MDRSSGQRTHHSSGLPLLPNKTETDRAAMTSCWRGERKGAYEESRKRLGITREAVWIQSTPQGDVAVVYVESDDVEAAYKDMAVSQEPSTAGSATTCWTSTASTWQTDSRRPSRSWSTEPEALPGCGSLTAQSASGTGSASTTWTDSGPSLSSRRSESILPALHRSLRPASSSTS